MSLDRAKERARAASECIRCHQKGHFAGDCSNLPITPGESDKEFGKYQGTTETVATEQQTSQGT